MENLILTQTAEEASGDDVLFNIYAELESNGKTVDGNAQTTTVEESENTDSFTELKESISEKVEITHEPDEQKQNISLTDGKLRIHFSATNWLLFLIAFLVFLHLIFKN